MSVQIEPPLQDVYEMDGVPYCSQCTWWYADRRADPPQYVRDPASHEEFSVKIAEALRENPREKAELACGKCGEPLLTGWIADEEQ